MKKKMGRPFIKEEDRKIQTNFLIKPWVRVELDKICEARKLKYGATIEFLVTEYLKGSKSE